MNEIHRITEFFKRNKIQIVKLNHCLREKGPTEFEALLQLSEDGEHFTITNKIPLKNAHLRTADKYHIENEKFKVKIERMKKLK